MPPWQAGCSLAPVWPRLLLAPGIAGCAGNGAVLHKGRRRLSQGCKGEAFLQGTKCQLSNGGVLGRAALCPVGLFGSLTRAETKLLSARLSELFLSHV